MQYESGPKKGSKRQAGDPEGDPKGDIFQGNIPIYTVIRPALCIYGGKPCPFHLMSFPSECKAKSPAAGIFSLKKRVKTYKLVNFKV